MDGVWVFYAFCSVVVVLAIIFVIPAAKKLRDDKNKK